MIQTMSELASSHDYTELYTSSEDILNIFDNICKSNFSKAVKVYSIEMNEKNVKLLMEALTVSDYNIESFPKSVQSAIKQKFQLGIASIINGRLYGANALAASTIISVERSFVYNTLTNDLLYIYLFEKGATAIVSFIVGDGNSIIAKGDFLMTNQQLNFNNDNSNSIEQIFSSVQLTEITN
ncbi:MAG: hypothetical protein K2H96_03955 [Muribaculaceae bacterium]|nr:hypothetical protein [Muribaculaceae bacterium]